MPDPVALPQMIMPDGKKYCWERREGGIYDCFTVRDGGFRVVATGDRKDAVARAKTLRKSGGTHPYRSVTQLVAKSFPLSLVLHKESDRTTTGGPGTASFCQYKRSLEIVVYADSRACLCESFREWGFGWSERRPPVVVEIPRPLTEEGIQEATRNFGVDTSGYYERIKACFPWLVD